MMSKKTVRFIAIAICAAMVITTLIGAMAFI